ncbi:lipoyl(octanoyl) transferase LipB [Buchnera aphidicola]|uniref:lipoyl(octanoyl) transferase LipB n=1 Tax=Buchnera aphidicola TaxID=9 RepID=UPI00346394FD
MNKTPIIIRNLGLLPWKIVFDKMNYFVDTRNLKTIDEIWLVEHYPIFTTGQSEGKLKIDSIRNIPVMASNRGGKITYHGPGQQVIYFLLNLKNNHIDLRKLLLLIESILLNTLKSFLIFGSSNKTYPGIYVNQKKICSIGLRIKNGCCLHGCSINVNMNLTPFTYIKPCGLNNIKMTQINDIQHNITMSMTRKILIKSIQMIFNKNIFFLF